MIKAYIDQNINLKAIKKLENLYNFRIVQNDMEQQFKKVNKVNKVFTLDSSTLDGPDVIAEDDVDSVKKVIGKKNYADISHIYSAHINGCNYFVTENVKDFIDHDKRVKLEQILYPLKIRRLQKFIKEIKIIEEINVK